MSIYDTTERPGGGPRWTLRSPIFFILRPAPLLVLSVLLGTTFFIGRPSEAGQLADGVTLTITNGSGNGGIISSTRPGTGSTFSMKCCGPKPLWTDIPAAAIGGSGTDGGIVLGMAQDSGGEELVTGTKGAGGIDAAWFFFSSYGTDYTNNGAGPSANSFADSTCTSGLGTTACTSTGGDITKFGTWWVAWNAIPVPMGGGKVDGWIVSGSLYTLDYRQTVPPGDPSGFGSVPYGLHLEGSILGSTPLPTDTPTNTPTGVATTPTPTPVPGTIPCDSNGCSGESDGGNGSLDVPADALSGSVTLTLAEATENATGPPLVPTGLVNRRFLRGGPSGTTFASPATLCLTTDIPNTTDSSLLRLAVLEDGAIRWMVIAGSGLNGAVSPNGNGTYSANVCGEINGFSSFGVVAVAGQSGTSGSGCGMTVPTEGGGNPPGAAAVMLLSLSAPIVWILARRMVRLRRRI